MKPLKKTVLATSKIPKIYREQKRVKAPSVRLLKKIDSNKKVVAVIISFENGQSYDHLFTSVEQQTEEGTQVLVYAAESNSVGAIYQGFL